MLWITIAAETGAPRRTGRPSHTQVRAPPFFLQAWFAGGWWHAFDTPQLSLNVGATSLANETVGDVRFAQLVYAGVGSDEVGGLHVPPSAPPVSQPPLLPPLLLLEEQPVIMPGRSAMRRRDLERARVVTSVFFEGRNRSRRSRILSGADLSRQLS